MGDGDLDIFWEDDDSEDMPWGIPDMPEPETDEHAYYADNPAFGAF